jgi:hypothetical protein
VNKTSADNIKSATSFLIWLRRSLPESLQARVRPHLEPPYQLALNILGYCESEHPLTINKIAQAMGVSSETATKIRKHLFRS